jgi:hypothetical protein
MFAIPPRSGLCWAASFATALCLGLGTPPAAGQSAATSGSAGEHAPKTDMDLDAVTVYGEAQSGDQLVGPYKQPAWTTRLHRFPTTRAYVLPKNVYEVSLWTEITGSEDDGQGPSYEITQEFAAGLPGRFQLDLYTVQSRPPGGEIRQQEYKIELRHALADWGEIPLNPTLYLEYEAPARDEGTQGLEYKLLLAETLKPKVHWAGNLIFEQDLEKDAFEYGVSSGLSYTLVENKFQVGAEGELIREEEGDEDVTTEFTVGPSLQWQPTRTTALRVTPMFGVGADSPDYRMLAVFSIGFGGGSDDVPYSGPAGTELR